MRAPGKRESMMLMVGYAALLAVFVTAMLDREPYDDSFFFKRIALNALDHGTLAWNVTEGPVYGNTSQLFQAVTVITTALSRDYTFFATRVLLAACLVAAFGVTLATTSKWDRGLAAAAAFCSPVVLYTALSGMETALVLALLSALLWLTCSERGSSVHWLAAPAVVMLVWLARPDAILLAVPPLLVQRRLQHGKLPGRDIAVIAGSVVSLLCVFKAYYGTALPLPFYAKQLLLSPYDEEFIRISSAAQRLRFGLFVAAALPLLLVALLRRDATNNALAGSVLVFVAYHFFTTIDVMGMHGRFYAPAVPLLAVAAARAVEGSRRPAALLAIVYFAVLAVLAVAGALPGGSRLERVPLPYYFALAFGALLLCAGRFWRAERWGAAALLAATGCAVIVAERPTIRPPPSDEEYLRLYATRVTVYRGMDALAACFGDETDVYHSEVGVPGLRFQRGTVTDLAGLFSPKWLFRKQTFDEMCLADRPEAIFLPHKNYAALNREIERGRCLKGYRRVVEQSSSPLHVRADLHGRYEECAAALEGTVGR